HGVERDAAAPGAVLHRRGGLRGEGDRGAPWDRGGRSGAGRQPRTGQGGPVETGERVGPGGPGRVLVAFGEPAQVLREAPGGRQRVRGAPGVEGEQLVEQ